MSRIDRSRLGIRPEKDLNTTETKEGITKPQRPPGV